MVPDDEMERALLDAARVGLAPAAPQLDQEWLDRGWRRLEQSVASGVPSPSDSAPLPSVPRPLRQLVWGGVGGLTFGLAIGLGVGHQLGLSEAQRSVASPVADATGPQPLELEQPAPPRRHLDNDTSAPAPVVLPPVPHPRRSVADAEVAKEPGLALREELDFLRRAQSALRQGNPQLAFGLMNELERIHPMGALRLERETTRVLSLCALGRESEAQSLARSLRAQQGAGVYTDRLDRSCASDTMTESAASEHEQSSTHKETQP